MPTLNINFLGGKRILKEKKIMPEEAIKTLNNRKNDKNHVLYPEENHSGKRGSMV